MKPMITLATAAVLALAAGQALAARDIKALGTTLTPWGAEKAGNKDGSIPAYDGGNSKAPVGFDPDSGKWPNPFANEKPLFSITGANMAQYADKLTPGQQELLKRWPTYRLDVYPTHRSYRNMSKERADATLKNAANPECKTSDDGVGMSGCWGGVPFPLPATGYEAMWNGLLAEVGTPTVEYRAQSWLVDAAGTPTMLNDSTSVVETTYWDNKQTPYQGTGQYYRRLLNITYAPARDSGQKTLLWYPLQFDKQDQRSWLYTTGQRRTRLAPEFAYDTPSSSLGGALNFDEISLFSGRMDRYDFKLLGKKEMFVRYNGYSMLNQPLAPMFGKQHINPDVNRWELHRVWVVEATLKPGKRHVAPKRVFFLDEDTWAIAETNAYDAGNKLFRVGIQGILPNYAQGGLIGTSGCEQYYDLTKGQYLATSFIAPSGFIKQVPRPPESSMTPDAMAGSGVR